MRGFLLTLRKDERGAVAGTVAISMFGLIAAGGVAVDYTRMVALDTEMQNAADQAALAAATQLDGKAGTCSRASNAAVSYVTNESRFANDGAGRSVTVAQEASCDAIGLIKFFQDKEKTKPATADDNANFVEVTVNSRTAKFYLTPIMAALTPQSITAVAFAGVQEAVCKNPPVMMCNPMEPAGNTNEDLLFSPAAGLGLRLVTGNADAPGNFGWLEAGLGTGASNLASSLGYNSPPGNCQPTSGVTTQPGMAASVLNALNTRFDVFANGNQTCPSSDTRCSPSLNSRKDLMCPSDDGVSCKSDAWTEAPNPYRGYIPPSPAAQVPSALPVDGSADPSIMGYPRDICHAATTNLRTCGVSGTGIWDRDAYFRVNYGWTHADWTSRFPETVTRHAVYLWEVANQNVGGRGIGVSQVIGTKAGFGMPATGRPGISPVSSPIDRRKISVAVMNCRAISAKGKTSGITAQWFDVFLTEPSFPRGSGPSAFTDEKDVYVEVIGPTASSTNGLNSQVIQRSVPTLIE